MSDGKGTWKCALFYSWFYVVLFHDLLNTQYNVVVYSETTEIVKLYQNLKKKGDYIMWTTPAATEMRFGFEVTMYVMNK